MQFPIYLDNHSTTRLDERVFESMLPYLKDYYGNFSSKEHPFGWMAEEAVNNAREIISNFIGSHNSEIIFTSGTTESNNLVIKGLIEQYSHKNNHIISSVIEHPSILEPLNYLEKKGINITYLPVDNFGIVDLEKFNESISEKTLLVTIMTANNETGSIQPIKEIGEICKNKGIFFHTDAAQAIGKLSFNVDELHIDFASFSAHKNYGPKGIGALYIRKQSPKIKITPLLHGGGQEQNLRSGTLNVPAIVGFGKCIEISAGIMEEEIRRIKNLRDKLENSIFCELEDIYLNGHPEKRLINNLNISLKDIKIDRLLTELRGIAISTGSACSSGKPEGSHVLKAMGLPDELMKSSIRFGLGRYTTEEEIEKVSQDFISTVKKLRSNFSIS